jgi:mevalonate pyrophosphate decarboxylase
MENQQFKTMYETMTHNINDIKSMLGKLKPEVIVTPEGVQAVERIKYMFYGLVKFLIDTGNRILIDHDREKPINNADVFIHLAEEDVILSSSVPGVKKAVLAMPRIGYSSYVEVLQMIGESIGDLHKCLDAFAAYYMDTTTSA